MADLTGNSGWKRTPNAAIKQRLNWAVTTNATQNTSTVIVSYWLKKDPNIQNLATTSDDCKFKIECGGKTVSNSQIDQYYNSSMTLLPNNTEKCIVRHTFTIPHNADGTKSITIKVSGGFGGTSVNYYTLTISKTITLPAIKMASTIIGITDAVIGNNISVSWKPYSKNFYYRLLFVHGYDNARVYTAGTTYDPIFPNADQSGSTESIFTYSGFTVPTELIDVITDSESDFMRVYLYTYSDSNYTNQVGFSDIATCRISIPNNIRPTIESYDYQAIPKVQGLYADGYVNFTFSINASGAYSSTIEKFNITYRIYERGAYKNGTTDFSSTDITRNVDDTFSCSVSTGYFQSGLSQDDNNSSIIFSITAEDSRGRLSAPIMCSTNLYSYSLPSINLFRVERNSHNYNIVDVWLNATGSSLRLNNTVSGIINYRRTGSSTWKSAGYIHSTDTYPVANRLNAEGVSIVPVAGDIFEENYSYDIQAYVYDAIGNVVTAQAYVGVTSVLIDFKAGGNGLGVGKMAETDSVEVALPSKFFDTAEFSDQVKFSEPIKRVINSSELTIADMINYNSYYVDSSDLASGFSLNDSNSPIRFGRVGNVVHIVGNIKVTANISLNDARSGKTFFTLPEGYRPTDDIYVSSQSSGMYSWVLCIDTNGNMKVSRYGKSDFEAIPAGTTWFPFNVTFFIYDSSAVAYS